MHVHVPKHVCVYSVPPVTFPQFDRCTLICAVCHTLRWRGQDAPGHQSYEFIMGSRQRRSETVLHGAEAPLFFTSLHWFVMNYSSFFLEKHWSSCLHDSRPVWQLAARACIRSFKDIPACVPSRLSPIHHIHSQLSFKSFSFYPPTASRFVSSVPLSIDFSKSGRLLLHVRVNSFKRGCE